MVNYKITQPGSQEIQVAVFLCHCLALSFSGLEPQWPDWEGFPENLWVFHNLLG